MRKIDLICYGLVAVVASISIFMSIGIWLDYPIIVNSVLQVSTLVIHLIGSTVILAVNVGLVLWARHFLKEYEDA